jgi:hypothetical protein
LANPANMRLSGATLIYDANWNSFGRYSAVVKASSAAASRTIRPSVRKLSAWISTPARPIDAYTLRRRPLEQAARLC